jgi:hypothetical protein
VQFNPISVGNETAAFPDVEVEQRHTKAILLSWSGSVCASTDIVSASRNAPPECRCASAWCCAAARSGARVSPSEANAADGNQNGADDRDQSQRRVDREVQRNARSSAMPAARSTTSSSTWWT